MARQRRKSRRNKTFGASGTLLLLFLVLLAAAGAVAWLLFTPFGPQTETFVDLVPGSSTVRMGQQLESAGVVRSQFAFDLMRASGSAEPSKRASTGSNHPATVPEGVRPHSAWRCVHRCGDRARRINDF